MCGQPYKSSGNQADQQISVDSGRVGVISRQAVRWIVAPVVLLNPEFPGQALFHQKYMNGQVQCCE